MESKNYWSSELYPLFLDSVSSCTYANCTDEDLQGQLDNLTLKAIARFKFPKISLKYAKDDNGYYWSEEVPTMREYLVLLGYMKMYWVEYQLSRERIYKNSYVDKNVTAWSPAALISSIEKAYTALRADARKVEEDYSRINKDGKPAIGDINV